MRFKSGTEGAGGCAFSGAGAGFACSSGVLVGGTEGAGGCAFSGVGAGFACSTGVLVGDFLGGCLSSDALGWVTLLSGVGDGAGFVGSGSGVFSTGGVGGDSGLLAGAEGCALITPSFVDVSLNP